MKQLLSAFVLLFLTGQLLAQGVTTSSMNGRVTDDSGEALIGANIVVTHIPSGTVYGNSTDLDGYYRIPGMRVGGPYKVEVSYTGFADMVKEGIYLSLGQTFRMNSILSETATELDLVTVTANNNAIIDGNRTGQETVVGLEQINNIPTVTRSIQDFARFNPLTQVDEGSDGFSLSFAGQNNRYNTIYIDGAVNNDVFGLAGSGTNGGQTGVQPISIDAIEEFQVSIAPFDVRQSGFAGGSINAVTRSGTNDFKGSAYYFLRNQDLAGDNPVTEEPLDEFTAETYGFRLGGPIIKDKLFFFVNAELQRDETPHPFSFDNYTGGMGRDTLDLIVNKVQNEYGYDPGTFENNKSTLESDKILFKLDYNLDNKNKLSLRHSFVSAENLESRISDSRNLNFQNGSEFFKSKTNSTAFEWNSLISNTLSNNLKIGLTIVRDDRDPFGDPFPTVQIQDRDGGAINFGAERFSTANLLDQDVFTITNDFNIYKGKHNFLIGVNAEYFKAANLFIRNNFGYYRYNFDSRFGNEGFIDFLSEGAPSSVFERSYSQVDNVTGDDSDAIAELSQFQIGAYIQDEYQATDNLRLTLGLRLDVPIWLDDQPENAGFNDTTITKIVTEHGEGIMQGAKTGQFIDPQLAFSPRFGFNWDVTGEQTTQVRGGLGVFTSRIPLVWPGGAFNNYGFNIGEVQQFGVPLNSDVNTQNPGEINVNDPNRQPSGQVDLFAADFKIPQVFKANLAVDHKFDNGIIATVEGLYTKTINNVRYQNLNLRNKTGNLEGTPDDRALFGGLNPAFGGNPVDPTYTNIMLASNTSKGYSYNIAATAGKDFPFGLETFLSYSYGDSYSLNDGLSSQNNSQWRGYYNPEGRNLEGPAYRSKFSPGHRVLAYVAYGIEYGGVAKTSLGLTLNAQSGEPFTYTVGAQNFAWVDDGGFGFNELVYVPNNMSEINLVDREVDGTIYTAAQQWEILNDFINDNDALGDYRGEYAERNSARYPFVTTLDLKFKQDFYIETANGKRNTLQLTFDIFNFTNLLNSDWGRSYNFRFDTYSPIDLVGLNDGPSGNRTVPVYQVDTQILEGQDPWDNDVDVEGFRSSIWQAQLGVRYIFE